MKGNTAFAYQNNIFKNLTNFDEDVFENHNNEPKMRLENLEVKDDGYVKIYNDERAKVIYEFEAEQNEEIYMYLSGNKLEGSRIFVNGECLNFDIIGNYNKMIDIGKFEIGEKVEFVIETNLNEILINNITLCYEQSDVLQKGYEKLSKEQVDFKKINGREYEGKINIRSENEYVLFTIPYDEGWSIKVDGKRADTIKVQNDLMAVKVSTGEHLISMKYTPKGFVPGVVLSAFGLFLFIVNLKLQKKIK